VVALRDRVRMEEAAQEGSSLRADGALPPYAEEAYADALLYLKRPDEARDAYARVLAQSPRDIPARYGKFFAAVELEDFATASVQPARCLGLRSWHASRSARRSEPRGKGCRIWR
jgi:biofilm PGA synthesis protein PgaA